MKTQDLPHERACAEWSNRILILSLLGIAYLTLFPFRFDFSVSFVLHRIPFLLGTSEKRSGPLDIFLNVLLFVPFGFGVCAELRKRGESRWASLLLALAAGAGVSYVVELLQFYIPARDSGWEDVITNTAGSVAGFVLFEVCGGAVLEELSKWEGAFDCWLSPHRVALLLVAYFAFCFGSSILLQSRTRLSNWDPQCILIVGNDASGQNPWRGQILLLQMWDRTLSPQEIRRMSAPGSAGDPSTGLLGSYDFMSPPPYQDQRNVLPPLGWTPQPPQFRDARIIETDAKSWLRTKVPVENLTEEIRKSSQFTVHVVCTPAATEGAKGRIVSLSESAENVNFHLRQDGTNLVFWFRDPLSERRSALAWTVHGAFEAGKVQDIVAAYDGSDAFVYLDGKRVPQTYRLSPGAILVHRLHYIQTSDLQGCVIVYETLVFLPAGLLIGAAARKRSEPIISSRWMLALAGVLPAVLLEIVLAAVSGRGILAGNIALSLLFGLAGVLLINADRHFKNSPSAS
ncbi:MAG TPA: VanZ family protein [Candidatus Acidoferrales bacterium]|jgi:VanZ family protein|nr:VanZ family protein [Candidatus Acidoferrales bacterium]